MLPPLLCQIVGMKVTPYLPPLCPNFIPVFLSSAHISTEVYQKALCPTQQKVTFPLLAGTLPSPTSPPPPVSKRSFSGSLSCHVEKLKHPPSAWHHPPPTISALQPKAATVCLFSHPIFFYRLGLEGLSAGDWGWQGLCLLAPREACGSQLWWLS